MRATGDAKTRQLLETLWGLQQTVVAECYQPRPYIQETLFFPSKDNDKRAADIMKKAQHTMEICIFAFTNDVLRDAVLFVHYRFVFDPMSLQGSEGETDSRRRVREICGLGHNATGLRGRCRRRWLGNPNATRQ